MNPQKTINFSVFGEAFEIIKNRWQPFAIATLLSLIAVVIVEGIFYVPLAAVILSARDGAIFVVFPIYALLFFVVYVMLGLIQAGMMNMSLKTIRNESVELSDFMEPIKTPVPFAIAAIILTVCTMVGYIGCGVGAIVAMGLTMFTMPLMLDQKLAPMDAVKRSFEILKSQWLMATCFIFVAMLIAEIGAMACGVGALFTIPVAYLSIALCYRDLTMDAGSIPAAAPVVTTPEAVTPTEAEAAAAELSSPVATPAEPEPAAEPESPVQPGEPEPPKD